MLNTYIYHQLPPTCFDVCYTTFREATALLAQKLYAVCNVVTQVVLPNVKCILFCLIYILYFTFYSTTYNIAKSI
jgi:hypothetical protein